MNQGSGSTGRALQANAALKGPESEGLLTATEPCVGQAKLFAKLQSDSAWQEGLSPRGVTPGRGRTKRCIPVTQLRAGVDDHHLEPQNLLSWKEPFQMVGLVI